MGVAHSNGLLPVGVRQLQGQEIIQQDIAEGRQISRRFRTLHASLRSEAEHYIASAGMLYAQNKISQKQAEETPCAWQTLIAKCLR